MTYDVKVPRASLMVCLQCPLCCDLIHGATTISECLHTFCKSCIHQRLCDGETDLCPICNVSLGCSPMEKLRADHKLDDICAKLLPLKFKERKNIDSKAEVPASPPVHRKERSLSSLGIGAAPSSAITSYINTKTKTLSRRSLTIRDTSIDEFETGKVDRSSPELRDFKAGKDLSETDNSAGLESDNSDDKAAAAPDEKQEMPASRKSEIVSHGKGSLNEADHSRKRKRAQFLTVKRTPLPKRIQREIPLSEFAMNGSGCFPNLGGHLVERSKTFATGLLQTQQSLDRSEHGNCSSFKRQEEFRNSINFKPPFGILTSKKVFKDQSTLAHLAEVAVDHAGEIRSSPKYNIAHRGAGGHAVRNRRKRGKSEAVKSAAVREGLTLQTIGGLHASASQQQPKFLSMRKTSAGLESVHKNKSSSANGGTSAHVVSAPKHDRGEVGLWFVLKAAENQVGDNKLPQIMTRYLRIKDGKLPVSVVKKYLVKKLDLRNESEVEITCRGQPVVPSLPLESIQGIWCATTPPPDMISSLKQADGGSSNDTRWPSCGGNPAEEYMMVLTYGRNHRTIINQY